MPKKPKATCCVSKPRCKRCPLRMLANGTLPEGFTVHKRRLVKVDGSSCLDGATKPKNGKKSKKSKKKSQKIATKRTMAA